MAVPTREDFDVVPLRKSTKRRLALLKGEGTYDQVIASLLAHNERPASPPLARERDPEEVRALADLAARRWKARVDDGRIVELGPRLFVYQTARASRRRLHVAWPDRRGFAP